MEELERVAWLNAWGDAQLLVNKVFSVENTARSWYENHKATPTSGTLFQQDDRRKFVGDRRRERAEDALRDNLGPQRNREQFHRRRTSPSPTGRPEHDRRPKDSFTDVGS